MTTTTAMVARAPERPAVALPPSGGVRRRSPRVSASPPAPGLARRLASRVQPARALVAGALCGDGSLQLRAWRRLPPACPRRLHATLCMSTPRPGVCHGTTHLSACLVSLCAPNTGPRPHPPLCYTCERLPVACATLSLGCRHGAHHRQPHLRAPDHRKTAPAVKGRRPQAGRAVLLARSSAQRRWLPRAAALQRTHPCPAWRA
jgi:hypothetical protein